MAENDSALTILIKSIIYPFSSLSTLFVGWFVAMGCFVLIGIPFLFGFVVRCGNNVLNGDDRLPDWEPSHDLIHVGLRAFVILLVYGIATSMISFAIGAVAGRFLPSSAFSFDLMVISFSLKGIIMWLAALPVAVLGVIALVRYVDTGDLFASLNPGNCFRVLMLDPLEFFKAWILENIAVFVVYLPSNLLLLCLDLNPYRHNFNLGQLCMVIIILLIFVALMAFITQCIRVFIWSKFYRRVTGGSIVGTEPVSPAA